MKAELIDLNCYRHVGEGANGESYDSISDPLEMIKLYYDFFPLESIVKEVEASRRFYEMGIPSPKPGELVTDGKRYGIRFRRIEGKRSISRALSQEPSRCTYFAREFAKMCRQLHSVHCPDGLVPDAKQQYLEYLEASTYFDDARKARIRAFIESIPEADTALHGDLHFGNALTTLQPGAPLDTAHELLFIDLGEFARGCPLIDLGMITLVCFKDTPEFMMENFHITIPQAQRFWYAFTDAYFFDEDRLCEKYFGRELTPDELRDALMPYVGLKGLLIEKNCSVAMPQFLDLLNEL